MKKQKMLKLTAFPANPAIENAFSAPVTHSGEISVVFRGRDISIHGWDGSSWSTIYTWNSSDPQFKFSNTYQSYYLKSLNGSEEAINVSFFSTESYQGSTPLLVGVNRGTKLYDIDEVPIYTADDHNKMLTVMSNGSLAWLLASESFIVPEEGGDGQPAADGNVIAGTFLEELTTSVNNINGAQVSNGIFSKITNVNQGMTINLESEGILQFNADGSRVNEEFTLSFWFRPDLQNNWNTNWRYIAGNGSGSGNEFRLAVSENSNGNIEFRPIIENLWTGSPRAAGSRAFTAGEWYHMAMTYTSNGSGYDLKLFVDGVKGAELLNQSMNLIKLPNNKNFGFGGYAYGGSISANSAPLHSIDSMQISDGVALTEAQVGMIAGQSDRQMSIETAAASGASFTPTSAGTFLEDFTMFGGGTVTDGVLSTSAATPSYYKKSGMAVPSTTATTAVFSMWFNPEQSQMGLYSDQHYPSQVDFGLRMFSSSLLHISTPIGAMAGVTLATPLTLNEWHHALVTVETSVAYTSTSSKSMTVKLFIDGEEVYTKTGNSSTKRIRAYAGIPNGTKHYIGAENYNGSVSYKGVGQFDFMEWVDDVTLSDAQILAMYNGGTRGWSVADGSNYTP
jgi:hypothetical protein